MHVLWGGDGGVQLMLLVDDFLLLKFNHSWSIHSLTILIEHKVTISDPKNWREGSKRLLCYRRDNNLFRISYRHWAQHISCLCLKQCSVPVCDHIWPTHSLLCPVFLELWVCLYSRVPLKYLSILPRAERKHKMYLNRHLNIQARTSTKSMWVNLSKTKRFFIFVSYKLIIIFKTPFN